MTVTPLSQKKTQQNQERFLKAYAQTSGNISKACQLSSISRESHYRWLREDSHYQVQFENAESALIDNLEQAVVLAAQSDWKAALAVLERLRPKKWNKQVITNTAQKTLLIEGSKIEIEYIDEHYAPVENIELK